MMKKQRSFLDNIFKTMNKHKTIYKKNIPINKKKINIVLKNYLKKKNKIIPKIHQHR